MPKKLSHYDSAGRARMVDVSGKPASKREAEASGFVAVSPEVLAALPQNPKGNPLEVARIAGIMAAKRTSELIPMCHPLPLSLVDVEVRVCENGLAITSKAATTAETGVEMEALVAVSVCALTLYDMLKGADKSIEIRQIVLERKSGGKSGEYHAVIDAVHSGELTEARIDQSVRRVLQLKMSHGLFKPKNVFVDESQVSSVVGTDAHQQRAQEITDRTVTLVKDKANTLPLAKGTQKVLVTGASVSSALAGRIGARGPSATASSRASARSRTT